MCAGREITNIAPVSPTSDSRQTTQILMHNFDLVPAVSQCISKSTETTDIRFNSTTKCDAAGYRQRDVDLSIGI